MVVVDLDLTCVHSFVVLADAQHFGRAAARLDVSASALSKRLVRLEHQVGARLVERDPGGFIALTPAGRRLLEHSGALLRSAREARRAAADDRDAPVVRLGIPGSPADHLARSTWLTLLQTFARVLPGTRLRACGVPYGRLEQSVLTGRIDLLLSTGDFEHPALLATPLMLTRRVLLLPVDHELAGRATVRTTDLADLPLVREPSAAPGWMGPWLLGDLRGPAETPVVDIRARSMADVQSAVLAGQAATIASATLIPLIRPGVAALPIADLAPTPVFAVTRRRNEREAVLVARQMLLALFTALTADPRSPAAGSLAPVPEPHRDHSSVRGAHRDHARMQESAVPAHPRVISTG